MPRDSSEALPRLQGRRALLHGAWGALPLAMGMLPFGFAVGALAVQQGLTPWQAIGMSALVNAGTAQFLALELWPHAGAGTLMLGTLLLNARLILLGLALRPIITLKGRLQTLLLPLAVTDPSWALAIGAKDRANPSWVMAGAALLLYLMWIPATGAGAWLGAQIEDPRRWGLDFLFVAAMLVILRGQWRGPAQIVPWLVTAGVALLVERFVGQAPAVLLGAVAGTLIAAVRHGR